MSLTTPIPVQLQAVSKRYRQQLALDQLSLEVLPGQVVALLGPNGAGKSTAMALIAGLIEPDQGQVQLWGQPSREREPRLRLGVMLQTAGLPGTLTAGELVQLASSYYRQSRPSAEVARLAGIAPLWKRRYQSLSGGQQRAVQFAVAICGYPELLLLDEPSLGLDIEARAGMWQAVGELAHNGCSVLLTTHHLDEAESLAERICVLRGGQLIADGSLATLRDKVRTVTIRCRTRLSQAQIESWPGIGSCRWQAGQLVVTTERAESVVAALLEADPELTELEVLRPNLADVFGHVLEDSATDPVAEAA